MSIDLKILNSIEVIDDPVTFERSYRFTGEITAEIAQYIDGCSFEQIGKDIIADLNLLYNALE